MSDLMQAIEFEEALIGYGRKKGSQDSLVYDYDKCLQILMKKGMTDEEAIEWMEYNVVDAYVGPKTPIFVHTDKEYVQEMLIN